ncbi:enolase C-terminal domain-like protein [Paenibacillus baekrokdamisoli]|nr:enolase C-terminal domain-like protein [Paenibacillus baekrokdamisoli]
MKDKKLEVGYTMIGISETKHAIMKEPLLSPFGFKGAYLTELWQSVAGLRAQDGALSIGIGVQSVLWSDPRVFARYGEASGNGLMADLTQYALALADNAEFDTPLELLDRLFPDVYEYGRKHVGLSDLRSTFALNALVAVDHAAWGLYSRGKSMCFEELVPDKYRSALSERQRKLASIPVVAYGLSEESIEQMLQEGYFLLKIKIGADPDRDGDQAKMLEWDQQRLSQIHRIASRYETTYTRNGKIAYYLDANGRYDGKERMMRFLDHADRIGALERIVLLEEPFDEANVIDVSDLPVRLAADESVHDERDAQERIDMGYGAIALKPVAKTMSMSLKVAKLARDRGVPCFCADLTASPILADWNKTLASYLSPLPELTIGAIEMNGRQNYRNWDRMKSWHPCANAAWTEANEGIFKLDDRFFDISGGALEISPYYERLLDNKGGRQE